MVISEIRAVVFDVGETLIDETRHWTVLADAVGVPPLTFFAVFGSLIERGEDHRRIWSELGVEKPKSGVPVRPDDLYPDALPCLTAVRRAGFTVGIAGNQPASAEAHLKAIGFDADLVASSERWGVEKPQQISSCGSSMPWGLRRMPSSMSGTAWTMTSCLPAM